MKYITWLLDWQDGYGYGPEAFVAESGASLVSAWSGVETDSRILGYLVGDFDVTKLSQWDAQELSENEALTFAQALDPDAFVAESGEIHTIRKDDDWYAVDSQTVEPVEAEVVSETT